MRDRFTERCKKVATSMFRAHHSAEPRPLESIRDERLDFNQDLGLHRVKRSMKVAVTEQYNLRLSRPPGCGKSMRGHQIHTILRELSPEDALNEVSLEGYLWCGASPKSREASLTHYGVSVSPI